MAGEAQIREALSRLEAGDLVRAHALCQACLGVEALRADAEHILGLIAHARRQLKLAVAHFQRAVEADPHNLARRLNLGLVCYDAGEYALCCAHLEFVLAHAGEIPEALNCLGNALTRLGQFKTAIQRHERALAQAPQEPKLWSDLAATYMAYGQPAAAVSGYARVAKLLPRSGQAHFNLGTALLHAEEPAAAVGAFEQATRCNRDHVEAYLNLGIALKQLGRIEDALHAQRAAHKRAPDNPEVQWNLALTELLLGEFRAGFSHFEGRLRLHRHPLANQPKWDGSPLSDRPLVILGEQGLGDTLQFLRFVERAAARCNRVILQCRAELLPLLTECYRGPAELQLLGTDAGDATRVPLMSLPHVLNVGDELGVDGPYLHVTPAATETFRSHLPAGRLRVGLTWQGNASYRADAQRSVPLSTLSPLLQLPGVAFVSLQRGQGSEQLRSLPDSGIVDMGDIDPEGEAFTETAPLLTALDLLITTDTAIAHLAGALGVEVWLLLAKVPDFRWGLSGNRWYPSMRLFRQSEAGAWEPVVQAVRQALEARCAEVAA